MPEGIQINGPMHDGFADVLSNEAQEFVVMLHRKFNARRQELLQRRESVQQDILNGKRPDFLPETQSVRDGDWQVAPLPDDLQDRRCEITGPTEAKMMINALNSGARVFMADLEDANSPNWFNQIQGQINLQRAIDRTLNFQNPDGREYKLNDQVATLLVRPRGWHLDEKHILIDGEIASGSLVDFGLYFFHNHERVKKINSGIYLYLPKLENHLEARLWNDVFVAAQEYVGKPIGGIKATILLEHILASFEIEEMIYELRDHLAGMNAGRWDYMFSCVKKFRNDPDFLWPDRALVTMAVPFMRAYTEALVRACHKRGAHAIGGMAAFIPSRRDEEVNRNALAKVRADKERDANDGYDGSWVAHPDLVPVCTEVFSEKFEDGKVNQKHRLREDVVPDPKGMLNFKVPGDITEAGLRNNISVGIQYIESWLNGMGAVAIFNLMEDAATAEISRSQIWQWIRHPEGKLSDGRKITVEMYRELAQEEIAKVREARGESFNEASFAKAAEIMDVLATDPEFKEFLTVQAYSELD
jgi:malate synthase